MAAQLGVGGNVFDFHMAELSLPEQGDEVVFDLGAPGHAEDGVHHDAELRGLNTGGEGDPAHPVAVEGKCQIVFARARRIERLVFGQDVVRRETEHQRAVLLEQATELARQLEARALDHGIGERVVEPAALDGQAQPPVVARGVRIEAHGGAQPRLGRGQVVEIILGDPELVIGVGQAGPTLDGALQVDFGGPASDLGGRFYGVGADSLKAGVAARPKPCACKRFTHPAHGECRPAPPRPPMRAAGGPPMCAAAAT